MEYTITEACRKDATMIAEGIMSAIGEEICIELGGGRDHLTEVKRLFTELAEKETSQYSYRNTLVAKDETGKTAGVIVVYDGALLHTMRQDFVNKYNEIFNGNMLENELDEETTSDEIYIDTLMVRPEYRRQGIGALLIEGAAKKFSDSGKPLGLLVDYTNQKARKLYSKVGFEGKGMRKFCGVEMEHMQRAL